jgi:hypothetical protein
MRAPAAAHAAAGPHFARNYQHPARIASTPASLDCKNQIRILTRRYVRGG